MYNFSVTLLKLQELEMGITEPTTTFSNACFGESVFTITPTKYAELNG